MAMPDRSEFVFPAIPVALEGGDLVAFVESVPVRPLLFANKIEGDVLNRIALSALVRINNTEKVEFQHERST